MDNAIRFQANDGPEQQFLHVDVGGRALRLCRIIGKKGDMFSWEVVTANPKVPLFRAFDWHPSNELLVAVGQSSGEASVVRLDDAQGIYAFQSGKPRLCNAVALNSQNLLAAGLDKVRTDFCLNVWDIQQRMNSPASAKASNMTRSQAEPLHKLAGSEPITSLKFFRDQPSTMVAGVKGQFIRVYDLRDPSDSGGLQFPTKCVSNIAIDGFDENYFASSYPTGDPEISIWDRRMTYRLNSTIIDSSEDVNHRQAEASLAIKQAVSNPGQIWSLRFSRTTRGSLGVLASTGQLRLFNILEEFVTDDVRTARGRRYGSDWEQKFVRPILLNRTHEIQPSFATKSNNQEDFVRVASFDFMSNHKMSQRTRLLALMGDGTVKPMSPVAEVQPIAALASGGFLIAKDSLVSELGALELSDVKPMDISQDKPVPLKGPESSFMQHLRYQKRLLTLDTLPALDKSISSLYQRRAQQGYLLNLEKNADVVADSYWLHSFWKWVAFSSKICSKGAMIQDNLDFSYLGVHPIWMGIFNAQTREIGSRIGNISLQMSPRVELLTKRLKIDCGEINGDTLYPFHRKLCLFVANLDRKTDDVKQTVKHSVVRQRYAHAAAMALFHNERKLAYGALRSPGTGKDHQMLAMAIAGAPKQGTDDSPDQPISDEWSDTLASIAKDETDPYARAILAYVRTGSWSAVVAEESLPLKYRLLVALRWYSDAELTTYIKDITQQVIKDGDIEGVILTGLGTVAGMTLMQNYIARTGDVQTAVLAVTIDGAAMKYCHDDLSSMRQYEGWQRDFGEMMNSWGLHIKRCLFDKAVARGAVDVNGRKLIEAAKPQMQLVCGHCNGSLARSENYATAADEAPHPDPHPAATPGSSTPAAAGQSTQKGKLPLPVAAAIGTVCPKCSAPLPCCGLCDMPLGVPDPSYLRWYREQESKPKEDMSEDDKWKMNMGHFTVFCFMCHHGFHAVHAKEWFGGMYGKKGHKVCPVVGCSCQCGL